MAWSAGAEKRKYKAVVVSSSFRLSKVSILVMMLTSITTAVALIAARAAADNIHYAGVSESSGEFGVYSPTATPGTGLPGRFGVDFQFINKTSIGVYVDQNNMSKKLKTNIYTKLITLDHRSMSLELRSCLNGCALLSMA